MTAMVVVSRFSQSFVSRLPYRPSPTTAFLAVSGLTIRAYTDRLISRARSASSLSNQRIANGHVDVEVGRYGKTAPTRGVDGPPSDRLAQCFILRSVHGRSLPVDHLTLVIHQPPQVDESMR